MKDWDAPVAFVSNGDVALGLPRDQIWESRKTGKSRSPARLLISGYLTGGAGLVNAAYRQA